MTNGNDTIVLSDDDDDDDDDVDVEVVCDNGSELEDKDQTIRRLRQQYGKLHQISIEKVFNGILPQ